MAKAKELKTLQAAFNLYDPYQKALYEYAVNVCPNTSGYIKRLIQRDMEGGGRICDTQDAPPILDIEKENMVGLI